MGPKTPSLYDSENHGNGANSGQPPSLSLWEENKPHLLKPPSAMFWYCSKSRLALRACRHCCFPTQRRLGAAAGKDTQRRCPAPAVSCRRWPQQGRPPRPQPWLPGGLGSRHHSHSLFAEESPSRKKEQKDSIPPPPPGSRECPCEAGGRECGCGGRTHPGCWKAGTGGEEGSSHCVLSSTPKLPCRRVLRGHGVCSKSAVFSRRRFKPCTAGNSSVARPREEPRVTREATTCSSNHCPGVQIGGKRASSKSINMKIFSSDPRGNIKSDAKTEIRISQALTTCLNRPSRGPEQTRPRPPHERQNLSEQLSPTSSQTLKEGSEPVGESDMCPTMPAPASLPEVTVQLPTQENPAGSRLQQRPRGADGRREEESSTPSATTGGHPGDAAESKVRAPQPRATPDTPQQ
ncbi:uncharacterized protein LOC129405594 [Sorex araneus]|uniref:uncharacterized protein LOC129405594 n=1 Tax=Sorex araneus TaxID=42254 RepID=UPI002433EAD2|nr:uncharacterized protein LOC129405594 [Sorex araneus]